MFRKIIRKISPNPLDQLLKKAKKNSHKRFLLAWNRGLGDIALGLYAIVKRIKEFVPDAKITFLIRKNLKQGFDLFEGVETLVAPSWERLKPYDIKETLKKLKKDIADYDVIIEKPDPTYWVKWQLGKVVPRLKWQNQLDDLWKKFDLPKHQKFLGIQPFGETNYNEWRNWPEKNWREFFELMEKKKDVSIILFGMNPTPCLDYPFVIDLRGKTTVFEMLSIIKNCCSKVILPDSGVLSLLYYLDVSFSIDVISLWSKINHGILKQNVASPNPNLKHCPLIAKDQNISTIYPKTLYSLI